MGDAEAIGAKGSRAGACCTRRACAQVRTTTLSKLTAARHTAVVSHAQRERALQLAYMMITEPTTVLSRSLRRRVRPSDCRRALGCC